jgi:hypothetical protein
MPGQIIERGEGAWLARVYLGTDQADTALARPVEKGLK